MIDAGLIKSLKMQNKLRIAEVAWDIQQELALLGSNSTRVTIRMTPPRKHFPGLHVQTLLDHRDARISGLDFLVRHLVIKGYETADSAHGRASIVNIVLDRQAFDQFIEIFFTKKNAHSESLEKSCVPPIDQAIFEPVYDKKRGILTFENVHYAPSSSQITDLLTFIWDKREVLNVSGNILRRPSPQTRKVIFETLKISEERLCSMIDSLNQQLARKGMPLTISRRNKIYITVKLP
jgi:hypothetical protein